jgi:CheY-like chemotaxis protein
VTLEFAVRDTGVGIPSSGLERLFEPFGQADPSMSRRFGGTGLGLSISKSLVEMMGGTIWVESEVGQGSTFYFSVRLPLAKELPADLEGPAAIPTTASAQLRILLVEDNPTNQKLATYILQDRGHVVEIAADGHEALSLTEQNRYDLILMDLQMPGMSGLEATAAIRAREAEKGLGTSVPIVAMTAHAMKGDRERCLAADMDGYLAKPVNAQEMIGLVEGLGKKDLGSRNRGLEEDNQRVRPDSAPRTPTPQSRIPAPDSQSPVPVFDPDAAITRFLDSGERGRKVFRSFVDEMDNLLPKIRAALAQGDLMEVGRLGHRMKGTVVYLGGQRAKEAALRVERSGKSSGGTASEAEDAINALEHECIALKAALAEHPLAAELKQGDSR